MNAPSWLAPDAETRRDRRGVFNVIRSNARSRERDVHPVYLLDV
jgi:hypothetical protein